MTDIEALAARLENQFSVTDDDFLAARLLRQYAAVKPHIECIQHVILYRESCPMPDCHGGTLAEIKQVGADDFELQAYADCPLCGLDALREKVDE